MHPLRSAVGLTIAVAAWLAPACAAWADCQSDFARDNRVKPEAGPFKLTEDRVPMTRMSDGSWVLTLRQGKVTTVSEVVPDKAAFRITSDAPMGDHYMGVGQKAWSKSLPYGEWTALSAEDTQLFAGATATYMTTEGMTSLTCELQDKGGRAVRTYRYQVPGDGLSSKITTITAQFDAKTGLPLTTEAEGETKSNKFTAAGRFEFDRTIQIRPPAVPAARSKRGS